MGSKVQLKAIRAHKRDLLVVKFLPIHRIQIFMLSSKKYTLRGLKYNRES
jgi:hypothetical protein